jgi:hypothetical protein
MERGRIIAINIAPEGSNMAGQPLYQQAAWASVLAPFIAVALTMCINVQSIAAHREKRPDRVMKLVNGVASLALTTTGFVCGVIGVAGAIRNRPIFLLPSLIGLAINGLILYSAIYTYFYIQRLIEQGTLQPG